jgi:hypothetical protein
MQHRRKKDLGAERETAIMVVLTYREEGWGWSQAISVVFSLEETMGALRGRENVYRELSIYLLIFKCLCD